jgi:putative acetyltransferase
VQEFGKLSSDANPNLQKHEPVKRNHFQLRFCFESCRARQFLVLSLSVPRDNSSKIAESDRRVVALVVEAKTRDLISSAQELIMEYSVSLGIDLSFENFEKEMTEFPDTYSRPDGRILVAIEGESAVGVVGLRRISGNVCELKRMYVRPGFRGRGIGRMLAKRAIMEAQDIGYIRMRLDTLSRLKEAILLYDSLGFREVRPYTVNPNKDSVCMELDLGSL